MRAQQWTEKANEDKERYDEDMKSYVAPEASDDDEKPAKKAKKTSNGSKVKITTMGQSVTQEYVDKFCDTLSTDMEQARGQLDVGQLLVFKTDEGYEVRRLEQIDEKEVRFHACDGCKKNRSRLKKEKVHYFTSREKMTDVWCSMNQ